MKFFRLSFFRFLHEAQLLLPVTISTGYPSDRVGITVAYYHSYPVFRCFVRPIKGENIIQDKEVLSWGRSSCRKGVLWGKIMDFGIS